MVSQIIYILLHILENMRYPLRQNRHDHTDEFKMFQGFGHIFHSTECKTNHYNTASSILKCNLPPPAYYVHPTDQVVNNQVNISRWLHTMEVLMRWILGNKHSLPNLIDPCAS